MTTIGTLFTGFGGVDIGAKAAGLTPLWGIEYDADIAAVARRNLGDHIITANILDIDPATMAAVDVLHASPPCPNFSVAKSGGEETEADIALAAKVAEFVTTLQPHIFTLENVYAYRKSQSWAMIEEALYSTGYWLHVDHVNAADYGVPQSRKRMIVRAVRGGFVPYLPPTVDRQIGWYEAIEDLIDGLPESQLAPWQLERLPDELTETSLFSSSYFSPNLEYSLPANTITADRNQLRMRAFLVGGANTSKTQAAPGVGVDLAAEPSHCIANNSGQWRAVLISKDTGGPLSIPNSDCSPTVTIQSTGRMRAILLGQGTRSMPTDTDTPDDTVTSNSNQTGVRAMLFGNNANDTSGAPMAVDADGPAQTVRTGSGGKLQRAVLPTSRTVAMTPRCLARFQTFPDWYELPERKTLAARGIGNAVPPLLYQRIIEGLVQA